jgi:hypothetical protein
MTKTFDADASGKGKAKTQSGAVVTDSASATASSNTSQKDASKKAEKLAKEIANQTATHDVNVINQTTDIVSNLANYNVKQINGPPDIVFYYTMDNVLTEVTETNLGTSSSTILTYNGRLYPNDSLVKTIGFWSATSTLYDRNRYHPDGLYEANGNQTFYLTGKGTITFYDYTQRTKNSQGSFVTPSGNYLFSIMSGSGDFLGFSGIVSIDINNTTLKRKVSIYLNKYI